ncbi:MAG: hypothetical protein AAF518_01660 [Spirochaetota bacterium]
MKNTKEIITFLLFIFFNVALSTNCLTRAWLRSTEKIPLFSKEKIVTKRRINKAEKIEKVKYTKNPLSLQFTTAQYDTLVCYGLPIQEKKNKYYSKDCSGISANSNVFMLRTTRDLQESIASLQVKGTMYVFFNRLQKNKLLLTNEKRSILISMESPQIMGLGDYTLKEIKSAKSKKQYFDKIKNQQWQKKKFNSIFEISTVDKNQYYILFLYMDQSRINGNRFYIQWPYYEQGYHETYRESFQAGNLLLKGLGYVITPIFIPFDILATPGFILFLIIST